MKNYNRCERGAQEKDPTGCLKNQKASQGTAKSAGNLDMLIRKIAFLKYPLRKVQKRHNGLVYSLFFAIYVGS